MGHIKRINSFQMFQCEDCGMRIAVDDPECIPDCPNCSGAPIGGVAMWVLTEDGKLVNLTHVSAIVCDDQYAGCERDNDVVVSAYEAGWAGWRENEGSDTWHPQRYVLCKCDDEEQGKRVVAELTHCIHDASKAGDRVITMHDVLKRTQD